MKLVAALFLLVFSGAAALAGDPVTLSGFVRDESGAVIADILVHARSGGGDEASVVSGRTREDGSYSVEVPDGSLDWWVVTDERELLERGFFCEPGFNWETGDPLVIPELTTVPLRPEVTLVRSEDRVTCVRLDFDWIAGINPSVLRQYRIERSLDMKQWSEVITVALGCPPMSIFDETQTEMEGGYYRAVPVESVTVIELEGWERELIADPDMGWEGDPVLFFNAGDPLPQIPVMAPDIFIQPEESP